MAETYLVHRGLDSSWIRRSAGGVMAHPLGWEVTSDEWADWIVAHPSDVIIRWLRNTCEYGIRMGGVEVRATPLENMGRPWYPNDPPTDLRSLPGWAVQALKDIGEVG